MIRPYILAETNWKSVKDSNYDMAILPWAATEAHNYHLAYATDVIEADHVSGYYDGHSTNHNDNPKLNKSNFYLHLENESKYSLFLLLYK